MAQKLYVGNLPFTATEDEIRDVFLQYGEVVSVRLINDRETGRPRGFGFVEFASEESADQAVRALDGQDFGGRSLRVNAANDQSRR